LVVLIIVIALVLVAGLFTWLTYNRLVARRLAVDNSWAQIETALQRRHDLIPNLVETVKGYAAHERQTFENVTKARGAAQSAQGPQNQAVQESVLTAALRRLMAVAENYPQLRATENFQQLSANLSDTENQIAVTRRVYNDTVQTYNTLTKIFPPVIIAKLFNFEPRDFFDAPGEAEVVPDVSFSGQGGQPAAPAPEGATPS
jgi:LemA protein